MHGWTVTDGRGRNTGGEDDTEDYEEDHEIVMMSAFSRFSLPQISTVARRTALGALGVGVLGFAGLALGGYAIFGLGICMGLGMALANFRLIQAATVKAAASQREDKRRPLAMNTLGRMGAITVVALGLVFVSHQLGFGVLLGLAVFQFMLLANVTVAMLRDNEAAPVVGGVEHGHTEDGA
ncbi:MAG: hypothetical protein ABSB99_05435 [Acidimicrobiales bacterium]